MRLTHVATSFALALAALGAPTPATACDCGTAEPTAAEALARSATVVLGRVTAVAADSNQVSLFVIEAWKGAIAGATITLALDGSSCGYRFAPGQDVLIYAPADVPVQQCAGARTARVVTGDGVAADRAVLGPTARIEPPTTLAMPRALSGTATVDSVVDGEHLHAYVSVRKAGRGTKVAQRVVLLSSAGACALTSTLAPGDRVQFTGLALWGDSHAVISPCIPGSSVTVVRKARPRRP